MSLTFRSSLTLLAAVVFHLPAATQAPPAPPGPTPPDAAHLAALAWRELGPAITSGRITSFAVRPDDSRVIYAATASGGLWKTTNAGTEWAPIFEHQRTVSMGVVTLAPSNPDIVWVGTGEQNSIRSSSFGDGVYRSNDGGETWRHMGLEGSRHVGRILVHPENSDIVYVAAMGSLWGPNPERGLYRSTDGGESWTRVLEISDHTGVVEVRMDPRDPDVLLAAAFQRERRQWSMLGGGPEGGLFRSEDGGESWSRVEGGFPTGPVGRIGIAFCPSDPSVVYASAVAPDGGMFRSDDGGHSWERRNAEVQSHWFYGELVCDPQNPDRIYAPMTPLNVSDDGGRTFRNLVRTAVHVDHHALWVNPQDPDHLIVGNDGGIYVSRDRGERWLWQPNVPVMQLYTASFDLQEPFYHVYGGTQDNGSWGGPVGTRFGDGVANEDWLFTAGGDGFFSKVDPSDADIIYAESQYGVLQRMDRRTGERVRIQPWQPQDGDAVPYRWNWSAPLEISPHDPATLYFAANVVFRSPDRGDSWRVISPDLTRGISRDSLPLQGRIQPPDAIDLHASTALYGNVSALAVSPVRPGLVAAGTDDGLVQVTEDDGGSWRRSATFPGVPEMAKVSMVAWSGTNEGTLFVTFDAHKDNDFRPHVVRSDDHGRSWRNVTGDLPEFGPTRSVAVHPRTDDLVFVGTEFGVFASLSGGGRWVPLRHGLPTNAVHGLAVHPRENDLIAGTHGRGFWVLDNVGLLEALAVEGEPAHSLVAAPRRAWQIRDVNRGRGSVGDTYWTADNPPRGAILDYWIGAEAVGEPVSIDVLDAEGAPVRRLEQPTATPGAHRVVWDLRHEAPRDADGAPSRRYRGRFVTPGSYEVRLVVGERTHVHALEVRADPELRVSAEERRAHDRTVALQARLVEASAVASAVVDEVLTQLSAVVTEAARVPAAPADEAAELQVRFRAWQVELEGPGAGGIAQQETTLPLETLVARLYSTTESWSGAPTADQARLTARAHGDLYLLLEGLRDALSTDLPGLREAMADVGVAWPAESLPTISTDLLPPPTP